MNEKINQVLNSTSARQRVARKLLKLLLAQKTQPVKTTYPVIEKALGGVSRCQMAMAVAQLQNAGILSVKETGEVKSNRTHFYIFQLNGAEK